MSHNLKETQIMFSKVYISIIWDSQVALVVKNLPASAGDMRDVGSILWRRARQPTPVFLPGESHGQRSLAGYGP